MYFKGIVRYINIIRKSKFRYFVFPVRSYEFKRFLSMAFLMFFILFNQNLVRNIKDTLVVTSIGTEVLSFIKLWLEMPFGVIFVIGYSKLIAVVSMEKAFRIIVLCFLSFFLIFTFILLPNIHIIHPNAVVISKYVELFPHFKWFIISWGNWSFVLFYIVGELWPVIVMSLLFWQLANKVSKVEEASRFYVFFSLIGQANLLISGSIIWYCTHNNSFVINLLQISENYSKEYLIIYSLTILILLSGLVILCIHKIVEVQNKDIIDKLQKRSYTIHKKTKLLDDLKLLMESRSLKIICVLIICYSTSINLIEGIWLSRTRALYPDPNNFAAYQGKVLFLTGVSTMLFALLGGGMIKHFKWVSGAILTPTLLLIFGGVFFILTMLEKYHYDSFFILFGMQPLLMVVSFATIQHALCKGVKYSVFDATKEMVYMTLDDQIQTKGKATVDVIGTKIGKSVGAFMQFITFSIFPQSNHEDIVGFLFTAFLLICIIWIYSVLLLNKEYTHNLQKL